MTGVFLTFTTWRDLWYQDIFSNNTGANQSDSTATKTNMSKEDQGSSSGSKSAIDMSDLYSKEIEELLQTDSEDELVPAEPYGNEDTLSTYKLMMDIYT